MAAGMSARGRGPKKTGMDGGGGAISEKKGGLWRTWRVGPVGLVGLVGPANLPLQTTQKHTRQFSTLLSETSRYPGGCRARLQSGLLVSHL